jgi:polyisoprenyl-phosphate glycosyltransferase
MKKNKKHIHPSIGIVVPVFQEESVIEMFHAHLVQVIQALPNSIRIYYVDDGSKDGTGAALEKIAVADERVVVITLSRNFGHQAALTAGMDQAEGDVIITLDGDGQHPPELIEHMLKLHAAGYDIVQTQRDDSRTDGAKKSTSGLFYWLINRISNTEIQPGTADFRLLSRKVVDTLKSMPEYHRFLRGLIPWMGFQSVILPYQPLPRMAGKSKYSFKKMTHLAADAIFSFSTTPIKLTILLGILFLVFAVLEVIYVSSFWVTNNISALAPGWSSLMFVILFGNALVLINVGVLGIYVGYVFQQVKGRPVYIIESIQKRE